jgi:peptidoglycan hydrolase-like protein with peptidoglycan-binding domain
MVEPAASAMRAMVSAAARDGVQLAASGTWRSLQQQIDLFKQRFDRTPRGGKSKRWDGFNWFPIPPFAVDSAATPGTSNHGKGLAVDLSRGKWNVPLTDVELKWLAANGPRFGYFNTVKSEAHHWGYCLGDALPDGVTGSGGPSPSASVDWDAIAKLDKAFSAIEYPGALRRDDRGEAVKAVQWKLHAAGFGIVVDGRFGKNTEAAVKDFGLQNGLVGDGVVDAELWGRLGLKGGAGGAPPFDASRPDVPDEDVAAVTFSKPFGSGSSGADVAAVQMKLASFGYTVERNGEFGPRTKKAVTHFQKVNGRPQNGKVDAELWGLLGLP